MSKNKLLLLLVLLLMAVSGAWAQLAITTDLADSYDAKVGSPITLSIEASNAQYYQWYKKYPQGNAMIVGATSSSYAFTPKEAGETKLFCRVLGYNNDYVESKITTVIATVPQTYSVTLKEGTEDEGNWSVPKEAAEGSPVIATYNGTKKVKSVKAVKKALDPAKAYLTWDADQKMLVATEIPTTATKAENANENVSWAGTYVVEDDVTISGTIGLSGDVDLIIKDGATLTAKQIGGSGNNLRIYGQANQSGQLVVNRTNGDASAVAIELHLVARSYVDGRGDSRLGATVQRVLHAFLRLRNLNRSGCYSLDGQGNGQRVSRSLLHGLDALHLLLAVVRDGDGRTLGSLGGDGPIPSILSALGQCDFVRCCGLLCPRARRRRHEQHEQE
jgi:hypothetical protein